MTSNIKIKRINSQISSIIIDEPKTYNSLSFKNLSDLLKSLKKLDKAPSLKLNADVKTSQLKSEGKDIFEVDLIIKGETNNEKNTLFKVDSVYTGIFTISNAENKILEKILNVECPKFLFPFIRAVIASTTREAGFPPLSVAPIDFNALHESKNKKK